MEKSNQIYIKNEFYYKLIYKMLNNNYINLIFFFNKISYFLQCKKKFNNLNWILNIHRKMKNNIR